MNQLYGLTPDTGVLRIPPDSWGPFDCADPQFAEASVAQGVSVDVVAFGEYSPVELGVTSVRFNTLSGLFGWKMALVHEDIEVRPIGVVVLPAARSAELGEQITFTATVSDALDETLEFTATGGALVQTSNYTAVLTTPASPWSPAIEVTARSTSTGGIRGGPNPPERSGHGSASYRDGLILIEPALICVRVGETQSFAATVLGLEDQRGRWPASDGTFEGGVYSAPTAPNPEVVITATSLADDSIVGSTLISVSQCVCHWTASVSGDLAALHGGSEAVFGGGQGITVWNFSRAAEDQDPPFFGVQLLPDLQSGTLGPVVLNTFSYMVRESVFYTALEDEDLGSEAAVMTIDVNDNGSMEGRIQGRLFRILGSDPLQLSWIDVTLAFRAVDIFDPDGCDPDAR